jgi:hypothetical protein
MKITLAATAALIAITPAVATAQSKLDVGTDPVIVEPVEDEMLVGPGISPAVAAALVAGIGGAVLLAGVLSDDDDSTPSSPSSPATPDS